MARALDPICLARLETLLRPPEARTLGTPILTLSTEGLSVPS